MTTRTGFRVEFRDAATLAQNQNLDLGRYIGSAQSGAGQFVVAFPLRQGELVAVDTLAPEPGIFRNTLAAHGPFLRVEHIEHWPVLANSRGAPEAFAVLYVPAPRTDVLAVALVRGFEAAGWAVHASTPGEGEDSPLSRAVQRHGD